MKKSLSEGKYYYFRHHEWEGGWGVKRDDGKDKDELIALTYDKNYAAIIADALNNYVGDTDLLKEIEKYSIKN